ncbi:amino acid permease [Pseudovirgaria hyperparasitica]|uniref:Amino acid permease n=1 Tax=Pseudovirgaria hyperparasitica TaxID=470096 RepID=A0A6A6WI93_9PEZI|nr:amino acid permease [Pseudovirgaria hyperparasitica]KAF2761959.1 amino acid permease [Pseudovirgaria hyperparasitica]
MVGQTTELKRQLKSRHLQMIAIGGTIGTGLFIGSGSALATAGPIGSLIAYVFVGTIVYSVMVSLGEMTTYIPVSGAFTAYASRFVDPTLAFAMGFIYWFSWAITYALELSVAGYIIQYWDPSLNIGIWIGVFWVLFTSINFLPVSFYGELEFWFASIKVVTIIGFMIFAICVDAGVGKQPYLGFHNWLHPGPFVPYLITGNDSLAKFVGFWAVLIKAGFAYQGTELLAIAAGETKNPRKEVPSAVRKTFFRILFLFCLTIFFIGLLVPSDNDALLSDASDASASPLVIAANLAGIAVLPSIINAVLLTAVLSAANSNVYSGSRILLGLAKENLAPSFFARTTRRGGVPVLAVCATAVFGLLGFLNLSASGGNVFNWLLNITAVAGFIVWACIGVCHLRFMDALKARGQSRDTLPYKAPLQPYLTWYGLFFNVLIILTQGFTAFIPFSVTDFFVAYVSLLLFVALWVGHKLVCRTAFVRAAEADLDSGRREIDELDLLEEEAAASSLSFKERMRRWL